MTYTQEELKEMGNILQQISTYLHSFKVLETIRLEMSRGKVWGREEVIYLLLPKGSDNVYLDEDRRWRTLENHCENLNKGETFLMPITAILNLIENWQTIKTKILSEINRQQERYQHTQSTLKNFVL